MVPSATQASISPAQPSTSGFKPSTSRANQHPPSSSHTGGRQPLQSIQPKTSNLPLGTEPKPARIVDPTSILKWEDFLYVMLKWNAKWFDERGK